MNQRDDLIQSLCDELEPVRPVTGVDRKAVVWLLLSAVFVVLITGYFAPIREGALRQLMEVPRFLVETGIGIVAIAMLSLCAFRAAIPGRLTRGFFLSSCAVLVVWLLQYVIGLVNPALPPSAAGERHACWAETMVYALPPMLAAMVVLRPLYSLSPRRTALCFALAAALLPALYMQIACMYQAPHILLFHILPALVIATLGGGLTWWFIRVNLPRVSGGLSSH